MSLNTARLDRFLSEYCKVSRRDVRLMLAKKRVCIDDYIADDIGQRIDRFSKITLDGDVLQDNIPLQSAAFFNHNALLEINIANTSKIEIIRGPASSMYGSEAIGGAVNFVSKKASAKAIVKAKTKAKAKVDVGMKVKVKVKVGLGMKTK